MSLLVLLILSVQARTTPSARLAKRSRADRWESNFRELLFFRTQHGHSNVPKAFSSNLRLGTWVNTQRTQFARFGHLLDPPSPFTSSQTMRHDQIFARGPLQSADYALREGAGGGCGAGVGSLRTGTLVDSVVFDSHRRV